MRELVDHPVLERLFYLGIYIIGAAYLIWRVWLIFIYDYDISGIENNVIYGIQKLVFAQELYTSPSSIPFDIIQKSPLYYYLNYWVIHLLGLKDGEPIIWFRISRGISLFCNILVLWTVFSIDKRSFNLELGLSLSCGILALISLTEHYYSRMDALFLAFAIWSIAYLLRTMASISRVNVQVLALILVCSIYSKQSGMILTSLIGMTMLFSRIGIKKLVSLILYMGLWGGLTFWLMRIDPIQFYENAILGVNNGISLYFIKKLLISEIQLPILLMIGCLLWIFSSTNNAKLKVLCFLGMGYWLIGLFMSFKVAAGLNYFSIYKILLIVVLASWIVEFKNEEKRRSFGKVIFTILAFLIVLSKVMDLVNKNKIEPYIVNAALYENERQVAVFIQNSRPGEIYNTYFIENGFLTHWAIEQVVVPVKSTTSEIYRAAPQQIDYSDLYDRFSKGHIVYVVSRTFNSLKGKNCFDYPLDDFSWVKTIGQYHIFQNPKSAKPFKSQGNTSKFIQ